MSGEGAKKYEVSPAENTRVAAAAAATAESTPIAHGNELARGASKPNLVKADSVMPGVESTDGISDLQNDDSGHLSLPLEGGSKRLGLSRDSVRKRFTNVALRRGKSSDSLASNILQSSLLPKDVELAKSTRGRTQQKHLFRKLLNSEAVGSRSVGGEAPRDSDEYALAQSNNYVIPDTVEHAQVIRSTTPRKRQLRRYFVWVLYAVIGLTVSLAITIILTVCGEIETARVKTLKAMLKNEEFGIANVFWIGSSLGLGLVAVACVLLEPAAASSGIPGLLAFLNGVIPRAGKSPITGYDTDFIGWRTMIAKMLGMMASIPSGLCIGPEGPIIHISALLAYWTCHGMQQVENLIFPFHRFELKKHEVRDFLATGAACGICAAFRAPLAGCMFVIEEASSFLTVRHLEYTFFACLFAWITAFWLLQPTESFVKLEQPTGYWCSLGTVIDLIPFLFIAVGGGILGAVFNEIVENVNHWRLHNVNKYVSRRILEVAVLCVITAAISVHLPALFPCREETRDLMMIDSAGCLDTEDIMQISHAATTSDYVKGLVKGAQNFTGNPGSKGHRQLAYAGGSAASPTPVDLSKLNDDVSAYQAPAAFKSNPNNVVLLDNQDTNGKYIHLHYYHRYSCPGSHDYSAMAMLWVNGGIKAAKVLMQRGFPHMIPIPELLTTFFVYFGLAAYTAGSSVPAGLVIPMMVIGGSFGRLVGLLNIELNKAVCPLHEGANATLASNAVYWSTEYRWIMWQCGVPDPGVYAIFGMAGFMGGSGRITMMLATVLLELTDDVKIIVPVGVACLVAMLVGNRFNHGLYHGLIPLFNLPFLNNAPDDLMWLTAVRTVMASRLVVLPKTCSVRRLDAHMKRIAAGELKHGAFPLVNGNYTDHISNDRLEGLITVEQLRVAHQSAVMSDYEFVNLLQFGDRSPLTVHPHTRIGRAYEVFRKLGMRHLPVVDLNGDAVGMLTRKDLMTYRLKENILITRVQALWRKLLVMKRVREGYYIQRKRKWQSKRRSTSEQAEDRDTEKANVSQSLN